LAAAAGSFVFLAMPSDGSCARRPSSPPRPVAIAPAPVKPVLAPPPEASASIVEAPAPRIVASEAPGAFEPLESLASGLAKEELEGYDDAVARLRDSLATARPDEVSALLERFRTSDDPALLSAIGAALEPHGLARADVRDALS